MDGLRIKKAYFFHSYTNFGKLKIKADTKAISLIV